MLAEGWGYISQFKASNYTFSNMKNKRTILSVFKSGNLKNLSTEHQSASQIANAAKVV